MFQFRSLLLAGFAARASGQAVAPEGGCLICGDGQVVTQPDAIFSFPGQPAVRCGILQLAGLDGLVSQCGFVATVISDCECMPGDLPVVPTRPPFTPVPIPSEPPVAPPASDPTEPPVPGPTDPPPPPAGAPCPGVPDGGCSVCGDDMCVTAPDAVFMFPDEPNVLCSTLQEAGYLGLIPSENCPFLPELTEDICACMSSVPPTMAPAPGDDDDNAGGDDDSSGGKGGKGKSSSKSGKKSSKRRRR